jgi:cytochrome b subunit of formate dehydrogenase
MASKKDIKRTFALLSGFCFHDSSFWRLVDLRFSSYIREAWFLIEYIIYQFFFGNLSHELHRNSHMNWLDCFWKVLEFCLLYS